MRLTVATSEKGLTLKRFLTARFPGLSVMYLAGRVHKGLCAVDGGAANWGQKLRGGERIEIDVDLEAATARTPEAIPLEIVYEDIEVLAVNKPAGMLVHPTKHVKSGTLSNALAYYLAGERFWLPHRLDRETSGVMVIAKTIEATNRLARLWIAHQVEKRYLALVDGIVPADYRLIDAPIGRDAARKPEWAIDEAGKPAQSKLEVLERGAEATLVALSPLTGRTNQLRLHCAYIGHPIRGDQVYGGSPAPRLYLHAERLSLAGRCFSATLAEPWPPAASRRPETAG